MEQKKAFIQPVGYKNPSRIRKLLAWVLNTKLKLLTGILCRMDAEELKRIPQTGPLILYGNHINFLEIPTLMTRVQPRPVTGFSKRETWHNPLKAILFNLWGGIPLRRGEADLEAFRAGEEAIASGMIFAISPEGTRSGNGQLQIGHPGIILLAARTQAPLQPLAFHGNEHFWANIKKLKRTNFHVRVGNPFRINLGGKALSKDVRDQAVREVMYQLAALLPPQNRGVYSDLENATEHFLVFEEGVASNLPQAGTTKNAG